MIYVAIAAAIPAYILGRRGGIAACSRRVSRASAFLWDTGARQKAA